ncbi:MAG TPA: NADH-ubiquinone oxidoreductase-F iron-sulfur binding region domain-containing protein [Armatimonadota bacterium]|jgi:NADH-quinone oxidoreductase subunit F
MSAAERPLTGAMRADGAALSRAEYEAAGGYQGWRRAVRELTPDEVIAEVTAANLLGRGGAGFPAGQKWSFLPKPTPNDTVGRYVVVNADEMEPGTFKDRRLLEGNPHQVLEGALIAAYAVQARQAYVFVRAEYKQAQETVRRAIAEAYEGGYLGQPVGDTDFRVEMHLHVSAGRYMCGEGDALLNVIEGRRAIPRSRPPHQTLSGLWGGPTVTNNVETMSNVPHILREGAAWFRGLSLTEEGGTKLYGASGQVQRPGLWELPLGTPLREIIEEHAGGMREGYRFRGVLPGGASSDWLGEEWLDTPMDFAHMGKTGSRLGTGTVVVLDDRSCPVGALLSLERFFARESCGWCTPCRDTLPWTADLLQALEEGRGQPGELELLEEQTRMIKLGHTFCTLAPGAMMPLRSALRLFREDFEAHIAQGRCPWR